MNEVVFFILVSLPCQFTRGYVAHFVQRGSDCSMKVSTTPISRKSRGVKKK